MSPQPTPDGPVLARVDPTGEENAARADPGRWLTLTELAALNAILRERDENDRRRFRLVLNALVGTHTTGMTRALLQQKAPELRPLPKRRARMARAKPALRVVDPAGR